jgi:hypothetical protein
MQLVQPMRRWLLSCSSFTALVLMLTISLLHIVLILSLTYVLGFSFPLAYLHGLVMIGVSAANSNLHANGIPHY